ncbi:iron-containing alcohol dehydrogenase [Bifidobacterium cebidarum]|uniref:NADH-dependent butanol dehydrogenase n=1 Tax=Bifidobacterium cebidarum TaxID=2650773 RepID=A0A6I1GM73_9BIFI|nr:iron-containing alcohol dehydrogenase [Bifidobacterium cebidarum]KAB7789118.1 NADH-dependent butanol dehydrogenase [Bifidobacterium cebidarum]
MRDFTLKIGTEFVFGHDAETLIGLRLDSLGVTHVLIHHDGGDYLENSGLLQSIRHSLQMSGIEYTELGGVKPNPRLSLVRKGVDLAREYGIDAVVAVGGGSVIDSAKAIALGSTEDHDVWDYFTGAAHVTATLPVAVVLTCPASGSESSQVAVINNDEEHMKLTLSNPVLRPALAFMNPALSTTVPAFPTACGIVDMFSHICERYFSVDDEIGVIDRMAEGALCTLVNVGPRSLAALDDYNLRAQIMWISTIAQNNTLGIGREQDWSTHLIANELSALYDTPHGATLSIIMGSWMRVASAYNPHRFARYAAEVFGLHADSLNEFDLIRRGIEATESFFRALHMPVCFADYGLPIDGIERMLDNIPFNGSDHAIGSIARLNREDCRRIYTMAAR